MQCGEVFCFSGALFEQVGLPPQLVSVMLEPCLVCPQEIDAELRMSAPPGRLVSMLMQRQHWRAFDLHGKVTQASSALSQCVSSVF